MRTAAQSAASEQAISFRTQYVEAKVTKSNLKVLGVDLASRTWADNGTALIEFEGNNWISVQVKCIQWPGDELSPLAMATAIDRFAKKNDVSAVSLDGPQGWREPNAPQRKGVGRWCEYLTRTQGKTGERGAGERGRAYPKTQYGWISFCIEVFKLLQEMNDKHVVNDSARREVEFLGAGKYWLLECFPTSIWRESNLKPLPGKARMRHLPLVPWIDRLSQRYGLPQFIGGPASHDDLQAVVAALPAVGVLGGPCTAIPKGNAGRRVSDDHPSGPHWVEGIIWDSKPPQTRLDQTLDERDAPDAEPDLGDLDTNNPLLIEERADNSEQLLIHGVELFNRLVGKANHGDSVGIGYAQLVCWVHSVPTFSDVIGRPFAACDINHVVRLAQQITAASGGRKQVTKNGVTIDAGMDTFVWRVARMHNRDAKAFSPPTPYSETQWCAVFPDGSRTLIKCDE